MEGAVFVTPTEGMHYARDSVGIETVIVNGEISWKDGEHTTLRAGG